MSVRTSFSRRIFLGAVTLAAATFLSPNATRAQETVEKSRAKHVFIISFDGGKPAVMQRSKMPVLFKMAKDGAADWDARTILPSITLISHTSMLTGVGPAKHKIMWNDWLPARGTLTVPTVFAVARAKGLKTALFAGKEKFQHLNIPGTLDTFSIPDYSAKKVAQVAAEHIRVVKPNLCFIHFADSDGAGHQYGWGTPEQVKAFEDEDKALEVIRKAIEQAGIAGESVVIMSADHGGHDRTHGSDSLEDMTIPWITWGKGVKRGYSITAPVTTYDTAATALWLLGVPIPADWDGKPVVTAYTE